uniref:Uncharacterized protein n=1 Tax=Arundo donax TaxID=35708 RepID=A0A0A9H127_ARUDO
MIIDLTPKNISIPCFSSQLFKHVPLARVTRQA